MAKMLMLNPAPRKRRRKARRKVAKRRTPSVRIVRAAPRKVRRYRRNPVGGIKAKTLMTQTVDAFIGAGGAIGTDVIVKMLPLPDNMKTGYMNDVTRAVTAIGLGYVVEKGLKQRKTGRQLTEGALTVIAHGMAMKAVGANLGLSGYDDWSYSMLPGTGVYGNVGTGIGAYQNTAPVSTPTTTLGAYQNRFVN